MEARDDISECESEESEQETENSEYETREDQEQGTTDKEEYLTDQENNKRKKKPAEVSPKKKQQYEQNFRSSWKSEHSWLDSSKKGKSMRICFINCDIIICDI